MDFILNVVYSAPINDRAVAYQGMYNYFGPKGKEVMCTFLVCCIIKTTQDFKLGTDEIQVCRDTDSIQYRPKGIHKNTKGCFYMTGVKPIHRLCRGWDVSEY